MCTLYSGKYNKNSTLEVIQQSHSVLQFSQWFLLINNFTSIHKILSISKVRRHTVKFPPQETKSHFSFLQADTKVSELNAEYIVQCVHYHRPSKYWYCKFKPHLQHKMCVHFPPLPIILFTIIIPTWGFCHRLTTHSYETVLGILTDIFIDHVNQEFERKLKPQGGGGGVEEFCLNHSIYIYPTSNNNFHNVPIFHL